MRVGVLVGLLAFVFVLVSSQNPTPPKTFPPVWYTWVVTSVVKVGVDKPLYDVGQLIAFDTTRQWACRHLQQDLLKPTSARPVDYCDYSSGIHSMLSDVVYNQNCTGTGKLEGTLSPLAYPQEYLNVARFIGIDKVAQKNCSHFVAIGINVGGTALNLDVWTDINTDYPCQISSTETSTQLITTWAFDGFGQSIPQSALDQCGAAKILCTENNWVCNVKTGADPNAVSAALTWTCNPNNLDCSPIAPGGPHYIPNTLTDHANWAFNAYYLLHRAAQGASACNFGGVATLVAPANQTEIKPIGRELTFTDLFTNDLVCERV